MCRLLTVEVSKFRFFVSFSIVWQIFSALLRFGEGKRVGPERAAFEWLGCCAPCPVRFRLSSSIIAHAPFRSPGRREKILFAKDREGGILCPTAYSTGRPSRAINSARACVCPSPLRSLLSTEPQRCPNSFRHSIHTFHCSALENR